MKIFTLFLFVTCVGYISAAIEEFGPLSIALKMVKCNHSRTLNLNVSGITVHFYDFKNSIEQVFPISKAATGILSLKSLDKSNKLFMYVGGFKSHMNATSAQLVRKSFENFPNSYLIIIDHSPYTNDKEGKKNSYERSVKYVYYIGKKLAQMLADLNKGGISAKNIHCFGHSLGSQMLGHVGENFIKATGEKISRITALDPAGPCFSNSLIQEQVRAGVAEYVEVYHCNAGGFGTTAVLGDVDFFVNRGKSQPNCVSKFIPRIVDSSISARCNHQTCVNMWLASVADPDRYSAYKCDKYKDFRVGKCFRHDKTTAGFWNPGKAKGVYYFTTTGYNFS